MRTDRERHWLDRSIGVLVIGFHPRLPTVYGPLEGGPRPLPVSGGFTIVVPG